ncbi:hypothetical protein BC834DRAFT_912300, partial [Gloeopeniophorella convolvens]
ASENKYRARHCQAAFPIVLSRNQIYIYRDPALSETFEGRRLGKWWLSDRGASGLLLPCWIRRWRTFWVSTRVVMVFTVQTTGARLEIYAQWHGDTLRPGEMLEVRVLSDFREMYCAINHRSSGLKCCYSAGLRTGTHMI